MRLANKPHDAQRIAELYDNIIRFRQLYDDLSTPDDSLEPESPQVNRGASTQPVLDSLHGTLSISKGRLSTTYK